MLFMSHNQRPGDTFSRSGTSPRKPFKYCTDITYVERITGEKTSKALTKARRKLRETMWENLRAESKIFWILLNNATQQYLTQFRKLA